MFTDVSSYSLPKSEYTHRRKTLASKLEENTAVVLYAGHAPVASLDESYPFLPNRTFFYLTGIEQEDSVLTLRYPDEESDDTGVIPAAPPRDDTTSHLVIVQLS